MPEARGTAVPDFDVPEAAAAALRGGTSTAVAAHATGAPMKRIVQHPIVRAALARLLGLYLGFALRTTRWSVEGHEHVAPHAAGTPVIVAFWHERLALMPILWLQARRSPEGRARTGTRSCPGQPAIAMASSSAPSSAASRRCGPRFVLPRRGKGSARAARPAGRRRPYCDHPDGPRGPRRVAAPGVAQLAALSGVPVLPCAAQTTRRWILSTWDRMVVPLPFGRGVVVCLPTITVPRSGWEEAIPVIGAALTAAAERADRLCLA